MTWTCCADILWSVLTRGSTLTSFNVFVNSIQPLISCEDYLNSPVEKRCCCHISGVGKKRITPEHLHLPCRTLRSLRRIKRDANTDGRSTHRLRSRMLVRPKPLPSIAGSRSNPLPESLTWCPPCRKEMPDLDALYQRFAARGFVVFGISDEEKQKVEPFIREHKVSFPVLLDPGRKVNDAFVVEGIPKSFVYDREGKLVAQSIDMRTRNQFQQMLAEAGLK